MDNSIGLTDQLLDSSRKNNRRQKIHPVKYISSYKIILKTTNYASSLILDYKVILTFNHKQFNGARNHEGDVLGWCTQ